MIDTELLLTFKVLLVSAFVVATLQLSLLLLLHSGDALEVIVRRRVQRIHV
jgi:hypothetical protein